MPTGRRVPPTEGCPKVGLDTNRSQVETPFEQEVVNGTSVERAAGLPLAGADYTGPSGE